MAERIKNYDNPRFKNATKAMVTQSVLDQGKLPPQAVELEEAVLGALMLEEDALTKIIDIIKPETFYKDSHQVIFRAIQELFRRSEAIDILTVTNELKSTGELDIVGGPFYITQLTNRVASAANIEYHARILSQKFIQRQLISISGDIIREAFEDSTDVFDLLDKAETNLYNLSESNLRREFRKIKDLMTEAIREIEASRDHAEGIRGVPSGFSELDRVTSGWQKSDLIVLASRPGMGKTALALSIARNVAVKFNRPVVVFSLEMSAIQLVTRLISSETQLSVEKLRRGNLENYEWEQLNAKIGHLVESPLFINDTPALSIFELRAQCRRLKEQNKIELIIIDYLQLMQSPSEGRGNREQEISNISRSLKALAKELEIPIIALSQLSRAVETRGGTKKPILSDLRESGAIEQDADIVLFIYRPEYYGINQDSEGNPTQGLAEVSIAKHRNGALKDFTLRFISKYAKFTDYLTAEADLEAPVKETIPFEESRNAITVPSRMNELEDDDTPF